MHMNAMTPRLTTAALAALVGLALAAGPAPAQETENRDAGPPDEQARVVRVEILGMSCPFCAYGVEQKLKKLEGVKELKVELKTGIATLTMEEGADVSNEQLKRTVDDAGFEAAAIVRSFESEHEDWHPEKLAEEATPDTSRGGNRR